MASLIQQTLEGILRDGARSAKFWVEITVPEKSIGLPEQKNMSFICKGTSFPGKTLDTIPFVYKGRTIPLPGQHKYQQTWDLTFYLEEQHHSRVVFMDWMQAMNQAHEAYYDTSHGSAYSTSSLTKKIREDSRHGIASSFKVYQLDFDLKKKTAEYTLYNCFPISIGEVTLGSDQVGAVGEYTVTFAYSDFIVKNKLSDSKFDLFSRQEEKNFNVNQGNR